MLGDERLARLVGSGRDDAFTVLYERHHQALYRYCRSLVGSESDAQDALQTAMTGALVALRSSRRDAPLRPWLFRIAYNESMTLLRRRRPVSELPVDLASPDASPHHTVEERARLAGLVADLQELPERQRGVLVMRELSGLSHAEISEAFGITVGAAKQTVLEARRSLLEFAEGRAMACDSVQSLISDGDGRALKGRRIRAHMRECATCASLAAAIPQRKADLLALSPALPATAAAGLLVRITGAGSGHGSGGTAGLAAGTTTGKVLTAGISAKLLATGAVVVATAAAGAGSALHALNTSAPSRGISVPGQTQTAAPSSHGSPGHVRDGRSSAGASAGLSAHGSRLKAIKAAHGSSASGRFTSTHGSSAAPGRHKGQGRGRGSGASGSSGSTAGHKGRHPGTTTGRSRRAHPTHTSKATSSVKPAKHATKRSTTPKLPIKRLTPTLKRRKVAGTRKSAGGLKAPAPAGAAGGTTLAQSTA